MSIDNTIYTRAHKVHSCQKVLIDKRVYKRDPTYFSGHTQRFIECNNSKNTRYISNNSLIKELFPTIEYARRKILCINL